MDPVLRMRAVAHPLRLRLLSALTAGPMTVGDLARQLDEGRTNIDYHVRRLLSAGLIKRVDEVRVRGGVAHRFIYAPDSGLDPSSASHDALEEYERLRGLQIETLLMEIRRRSVDRAPGSSVFADLEVWVRPEDWRSAVRSVDATARALHDRARPPGTKGTIKASLSTLLFQMHPSEQGGAD